MCIIEGFLFVVFASTCFGLLALNTTKLQSK